MRKQFLVAFYGEDEAKRRLLLEHEHYVNTRSKWRKLRCLLYGCKPRAACDRWDGCTACPGRCVRCWNPVFPTARVHDD